MDKKNSTPIISSVEYVSTVSKNNTLSDFSNEKSIVENFSSFAANGLSPFAENSSDEGKPKGVVIVDEKKDSKENQNSGIKQAKPKKAKASYAAYLPLGADSYTTYEEVREHVTAGVKSKALDAFFGRRLFVALRGLELIAEISHKKAPRIVSKGGYLSNDLLHVLKGLEANFDKDDFSPENFKQTKGKIEAIIGMKSSWLGDPKMNSYF